MDMAQTRRLIAMGQPSITVYLPSHNYGRFLRTSIESVIRQSRDDWELIIIDDGSTDDTWAIAEEFRQANPKVHTIRNDAPRGLHYNANRALELARGRYIMRLDADDWLDDSALLVLAGYLDRHPDCALVYPNYFYVDAEGHYLGTEFRKRAGSEDRLLDLPAHGACTMVRKRALKQVGGYDETNNAQDGYELWLKLMRRHPIGNVSTPLFFYRQHENSLSRDEARILGARAAIKSKLVASAASGPVKPRVLGVIPAKNTYAHLPNIVLTDVGGRPLVDWTIDAAFGGGCDSVVVTTDDPLVAEHARARGALSYVRAPAFSEPDRRLSEVVFDAVTHAEQSNDCHPDVVVTLSAHAPLRTSEYVARSLNTLSLFDADTVVSVYEDYDLHFGHGQNGLEPINTGMIKRLRLEREALFVYNGAIAASWRESLVRDNLFGGRVSHTVMPRDLSLQIRTPRDVWLADIMLRAQLEKDRTQ